MPFMRANTSFLVLVSPLLCMAVGMRPARAASNLLENSPFLPANVASGAAQEVAPLELRSILKEGPDYAFSLYDPAKRLSTWAKLNEAGNEFVIKAFDPEKGIVTVEQKNRTYKLALKESKIVPLIAMPGAVPLIAGAGPGGNQGAVPGGMAPSNQGGPFPFLNRGQAGSAPSLSSEQLRNLEADINRRRELRRQAAAAQPGVNPPAQVGGQPQQR